MEDYDDGRGLTCSAVRCASPPETAYYPPTPPVTDIQNEKNQLSYKPNKSLTVFLC